MLQEPYPYRRLRPQSYSFVSKGRAWIEKRVIFGVTPIENVFNIGFGDLLPDGSIDDKANSNNGDITKVLVTVIHILKEFTLQFPEASVFFRGSTENRMRLYLRIVRSHYHFFNKDFIISLFIESYEKYEEVSFDPDLDAIILGIFIKRKS